MGCDVHRLDDGTTAIVCGRGRRPRAMNPCFVQECPRDAGKLCDYPVEGGKTCDRPCCDRHSRNVGPDKDFCLEHYLKARKEAEEPVR